MKKRLLGILLTLAILAGMLPVAALAADTTDVICDSVYVRNPLYADVSMPEDAETLPEDDSGDDWVFAETRNAVYVTTAQAAEQLRTALLARQETVTLYVNAPEYWLNTATDSYVSSLFHSAMSQEMSQSPYDGDYLLWSWADYHMKSRTTDRIHYEIELTISYYTTAAQEAELDAAVDQVLSSLNLSGKTDYQKYAAVYDYIASHVSYDYAGAMDINAAAGGYLTYTAYGALMNGKAVCQGYACLYYAMCRKLDLPVRIIASTSHAWNIVYLKGIWYETDVTWDSESGTGRDWFLVGTDNFYTFSSHLPQSDYLTAEFQRNYPVSAIDYDPDSPYNDVSRDSIHYSDILRATSLGLFSGTDTYTFSPEMSMSRAMLVMVLYRMSGNDNAPDAGFSDVPADAYYRAALNWAVDAGIINGMGDNLFMPDGDATREQLAVILFRYAGYLGKSTSETTSLRGYTDRNDVSGYALTAMQWAVGTGIIRGTSDTTLSPQMSTTRQQLATMLVRFIDYYSL